jgi:hypothetical protein
MKKRKVKRMPNEEFKEEDNLQDYDIQEDVDVDEDSFSDIIKDIADEELNTGEKTPEETEEDEQDDDVDTEPVEDDEDGDGEEQYIPANANESIASHSQGTATERRITGISARISELKNLSKRQEQSFIKNIPAVLPKLLPQFEVEKLVGAYDPDTGDYVGGYINPNTGERYTIEEAKGFVARRQQENNQIINMTLEENKQNVAGAHMLAEVRSRNYGDLVDVLNAFPQLDDKSKDYNPTIAYYFEQELIKSLRAHPINARDKVPYFADDLYEKAKQIVEMANGFTKTPTIKKVNKQIKSNTPKSMRVNTISTNKDSFGDLIASIDV